MRIVALLLIGLSAAAALSAPASDTALTRDLNLPRHGDCINVIKTELLPAGDAGTCVVWDFSEYLPVDGNHIVKYWNIGDSIISVIQNRTRFDYRMTGDTLLWEGYENRLYHMATDSMAPAALLFPMTYGRMAQSSYTSSGHHPDGFTTSASGIAVISADATGTLILPQADTLANALRVHRIYRDSTAISRPTLNGAIFQPDTLPVHVYEEYAWYAAGYRYPLVQSHIDTFLKGDTIVSRMGSSWICPPAEQEALNDRENSELRLRNRLQIQSGLTRRRSAGNGTANGSDRNPQPPGTLMYDSSVSIRTDNDCISVMAIVNEAIDVEIIMSDAQGRVFHHVPEHRVNAGAAIDERFPRRGMPPGVYMIAFMIKNGDDIMQKVILQ